VQAHAILVAAPVRFSGFGRAPDQLLLRHHHRDVLERRRACPAALPRSLCGTWRLRRLRRQRSGRLSGPRERLHSSPSGQCCAEELHANCHRRGGAGILGNRGGARPGGVDPKRASIRCVREKHDASRKHGYGANFRFVRTYPPGTTCEEVRQYSVRTDSL